VVQISGTWQRRELVSITRRSNTEGASRPFSAKLDGTKTDQFGSLSWLVSTRADETQAATERPPC